MTVKITNIIEKEEVILGKPVDKVIIKGKVTCDFCGKSENVSNWVAIFFSLKSMYCGDEGKELEIESRKKALKENAAKAGLGGDRHGGFDYCGGCLEPKKGKLDAVQRYQ